MNFVIENSWKKELKNEFNKDYFKDLTNFIESEYSSNLIYPKQDNIFRAFNLTKFNDVRVVLLGQDPYHGPGQAHGLCFSVQTGIKIPPSLKNICKEVETDLGTNMKNLSGDLSTWAKQGVFLLNATLTVRAHKAGSHQKKGWEEFTDSVIKILSNKKENLVFLLWGAYAQSKENIIDSSKHLILKAPHPSPLSAYRGFLGCKHFSLANSYLKSHNNHTINWQL